MSHNISLSKKVEIRAFVPNEKSYGTAEKVNIESLTDGIKASSDFEDSGWNRFCYGLGREMVVDLGEVFAVNRVDAGFLHDRSNNIFCPENIRVLFSENGTDYYPVSTVEAPYPASFGMAARAAYSAKTDTYYRARFVKIVFSVETRVYCDEITVYGGECNGYESSYTSSPERIEHKNSFAKRDSIGVCDIPEIPFGMLGERKFAIKREEILPYLAYIDKNGRIADTMFDSSAFVPAHSSPFGGSFCREGGATTLDGWKFLLEELFADGVNLCALDSAVSDLKKVLDMPEDYKHKVYLAAPIPKISLAPFGDINGDGIEDKLITTDDCVNAYIWFVDETKRRFDRLGLKNTVIDGWIWNGRALSREYNDNEPEFVSACVKALHERGYKAVFASDFQAGFAEKAEDVGFDLTVMNGDVNPNGLLSENVEGTFCELSSLCRKFGFGVEIDLDDFLADAESSEKYSETLDTVLTQSAENGMMTDTAHLYRISSVPGAVLSCAVSLNPKIRDNYDKLYRFIKGELSFSTAEPIEEVSEKITEEIIEEPVSEIAKEVVEEAVEEEVELLSEESETVEETAEVTEEPEATEETAEVIEEPEVVSEPDSEPCGFEPKHVIHEEIRENSAPSVTNINIDVNSKPPCGKCCRERDFEPKKKENELCKKVAVGLGIAAAAGAVLLISKIFKDKK